jgi:hypothetical protein
VVVKSNVWGMKLWPVDRLLVWIQHEFDIGLDDALSLLISHAKMCRLNFGAEGWPYHGRVVANARTQIKDLVSFAFPLGILGDPLPLVRIGAKESR